MKRRNALVILMMFLLVVPFLSGAAGGKQPTKDHKLISPTRLAFGADGNLLVTDYRLNMVLLVNKKNNEVMRWFEVQGKPLGIAYAKGRIYVGNATAKRIDVYNVGGKQFRKSGTFKKSIGSPTDMAVDAEANLLFVVDGSAKQVEIFDLKGNHKRTIPVNDPQHNDLANPTGIVLDTAGQRVFVSDYGDGGRWIYPRVQIFDYEGNLLSTIPGKKGMFGQRFSRPQGLALNAAGQLFMLDCFSSEILVFEPAGGTLLKTLSGFGSEPGRMQLPLDIVLDPRTNDLYVTNNRLKRIEIFRKGGVL